MALVDKQVVDAQVLKTELTVHGTVKPFLESCLQVLPALLQCLDLLLGQLALVFGSIEILYYIVQLLQLLVYHHTLRLLCVREHAILLMAQNHTVIIVERYVGDKLLAVLLLEIIVVGSKNTGRRKRFLKLPRYLRNRRFQRHYHRLLGNTHPAHLHDGRLHYKRLARSYNVVHDTAAVIDEHPHSVLLMRTQLLPHKTRNHQVRAVEMPYHRPVETVVVRLLQQVYARRVARQPCLEPFPQVRYLLIRKLRLLLVYMYIPLLVFVCYYKRLVLKRRLQNVFSRLLRRLPIRCRAPKLLLVEVDYKRIGLRQIPYPALLLVHIHAPFRIPHAVAAAVPRLYAQ